MTTATGKNIIVNYFGSGLLAARPAAPVVAAGCVAFYAATDDGHVYLWTGAAWFTVI